MDDLPSDIKWPSASGQEQSSLPDDIQWPSASNGAASSTPGQTVMPKTSEGSGPVSPPPSFKTSPSSGGIDPRHFSRFMNGVFKGYAGAEQLGSRALGYVAPETGAAWQQGADARAKALQDEANEQAKYAGLKPGDTDWWNVAGQVLSPINYLGGEGAIAGAKALPLIGRAVERSNIAKGALQGAGMGALQPVSPGQDYADEKFKQVGLGAGVGGAGTAALGAIGSVVKPMLSDAAQTLVNSEVRLTPGQLLGGGAKRLEDIAQSYPFAGQLIRGARENAMNDFQVQAGNRALAEIGERVDNGITAGPDLINNVEDKLSARYNSIHPNVNLSIDQPLAADLVGIAQKAKGVLPDNELNQFQRIIDSQLSGKIGQSGGTAPGKVVQGITSEIGRMMKGYSTDASFDKRQLAGFLGDTREAISDAISRQNPQYAQPLEQANAGWRLYAKLRDAAGKQGSPTGEFYPAQLERAAKRGESAGSKAKGTAPLQDFASAGKEVIPSKVPDSGTPERAAMMAALTHGAIFGAGFNPLAHLAAPAGIAAIYNPASQYLIRKAITARPAGSETIRNILNQYAPQTAARIPLATGWNDQ